MAYRVPDFNFPEDFYLDDVGVWRLKKEKLAEMEDPRPQTNEEWLRSCSTEQLATFLSIVQYDGTDLTLKKNHVDKWVEWLKKPHREEIHK